MIDNINRVVLDTNVLVAGLSSRRGASHALLRRVLNHRLQMLASPVLWLEYEAVLKRPEIRRMRGLSPAGVNDVLDALAILVEPVVCTIAGGRNCATRRMKWYWTQR